MLCLVAAPPLLLLLQKLLQLLLLLLLLRLRVPLKVDPLQLLPGLLPGGCGSQARCSRMRTLRKRDARAKGAAQVMITRLSAAREA